jgi:Acyl-CoA reductase (LuxC)
MSTQDKINLLLQLKNYLQSNDEELIKTKIDANYANSWFTPSFIETAINNICKYYLNENLLIDWLKNYPNLQPNATPKTVGIVMAGNIPLVGFHDLLCVFLSGNDALVKASSKDEILIKHIVKKLYSWEVTIQNKISFAPILKNCDAYIATGSNNNSRYFDYYFSKYPSIIRKNKTSVAVLLGNETTQDLELLANDILLFYGQGCRNVTKIYVPNDYDFLPVITALKTFNYVIDNHKYLHNYDYQLAMLMLNNKYYMTDGTVIITENDSIFAPISVLHFSYFDNEVLLTQELKSNNDIQCIVGQKFTGFGEAQQPNLGNYADGIDTMDFLTTL